MTAPLRPLEFAICFVVRGEQLLLVNRQYAPNMGLWNGVGGRLEPGEDPHAGILREVWEETGIALPGARFAGVVTWALEAGIRGGMHAFVASLDPGFAYQTPRPTDEGILDWKDIAWVLDPRNRGVVPNIARFLPPMLAGASPVVHHFDFRDGMIVDYRVSPITPSEC